MNQSISEQIKKEALRRFPPDCWTKMERELFEAGASFRESLSMNDVKSIFKNYCEYRNEGGEKEFNEWLSESPMKSEGATQDTIDLEEIYAVCSTEFGLMEFPWTEGERGQKRLLHFLRSQLKKYLSEGAEERGFSWEQVDYLISKFVCDFAPHHSAIESPGQFINRAVKENPERFHAPLTEK